MSGGFKVSSGFYHSKEICGFYVVEYKKTPFIRLRSCLTKGGFLFMGDLPALKLFVLFYLRQGKSKW